MPRLECFPFRFRDRLTGKWIRARYRAERHVPERYANTEWEITGPPEIRSVDPNARYFSPWRVTPQAEAMRAFEMPPQINPHLERPPEIDATERFLASLFLRRYVTYCARRSRFAECKVRRDCLRTSWRSRTERDLRGQLTQATGASNHVYLTRIYDGRKGKVLLIEERHMKSKITRY
jgi:hypothetical protein